MYMKVKRGSNLLHQFVPSTCPYVLVILEGYSVVYGLRELSPLHPALQRLYCFSPNDESTPYLHLYDELYVPYLPP